MDPYLGEIRMFAGSYAPLHWALCDGTSFAVADYSALFSLLGNTYGGDGMTTFKLPDLRGRIPIHQGTGVGLESRYVGQWGGLEAIALTERQIPGHNHPLQASTDSAGTDVPTGLVTATADFNFYDDEEGTFEIQDLAEESMASAGEGWPHDNMMPVLGINYIICVTGAAYPPRS